MGGSAGKQKRTDSKSRSTRNGRSLNLRFSASPIRRRDEQLNRKDEQNKVPSFTTLYDLPLEMLDIILQKSYLHWILNSSTKQRDEEVIRSLISVDVCFNRRITKQRFTKTIWRYLKDFYGNTKRRRAIFRNNKKYILENIHPNDELVASLLSLNCITEEQSQLIQQQRSERDKNDELLYVLESLDETQFLKFVQCLRRNNQKTVAKIIENGGVVVKVKVKDCGTAFTESVDASLLHQRMSDHLNTINPISHKTDALACQLRGEGVEVLNCKRKGRIVIVWIWCRSQTALEHIQQLYESNQLRDILFSRENIHPSPSKVMKIDRNLFKKTVVLYPISINFTQKIKIIGNEHVYGVTKLRNEIYVLCRSYAPPAPNVIYVFWDQNSFSFLRIIKIQEIEVPIDIGSSEKDNCVYVLDIKAKCVRKIRRKGNGDHETFELITLSDGPHSLSVSTSGRLLISDLSLNLEIFGSNGKCIRSIDLPRNMKEIRHAVETLMGNLIILHLWMGNEEEGRSRESGREQETKWVVSELTADGQTVIHRFVPSKEMHELNYLSLDSADRVFVVDYGNNRVILLDSDLRWNRILCPTKEEEKEARYQRPYTLIPRLCYDTDKKQLIVVGILKVNVYTLS